MNPYRITAYWIWQSICVFDGTSHALSNSSNWKRYHEWKTKHMNYWYFDYALWSLPFRVCSFTFFFFPPHSYTKGDPVTHGRMYAMTVEVDVVENSTRGWDSSSVDREWAGVWMRDGWTDRRGEGGEDDSFDRESRTSYELIGTGVNVKCVEPCPCVCVYVCMMRGCGGVVGLVGIYSITFIKERLRKIVSNAAIQQPAAGWTVCGMLPMLCWIVLFCVIPSTWGPWKVKRERWITNRALGSGAMGII